MREGQVGGIEMGVEGWDIGWGFEGWEGWDMEEWDTDLVWG